MRGVFGARAVTHEAPRGARQVAPETLPEDATGVPPPAGADPVELAKARAFARWDAVRQAVAARNALLLAESVKRQRAELDELAKARARGWVR